MIPQRIHFKNFDSIRGLAALFVLVSHMEFQKVAYGIPTFKIINLIPLGGISVTFFFVLSGFLICYLLIIEIKKNHTINIKHFYLRRILKIWPLYFLLLLFAFFIYKDQIPLNVWTYSIFFMPHVPFIEGNLPGLLDPIWSIGIEEQFYLFFPLIFLMKDLNRIFITLVGLLFSLVGFKLFLILTNSPFLKDYLYLARFDCMLIGAVFAFSFFYYQTNNKFFINLFKLLYSKVVQILSYILLISYLAIILTIGAVVVHQIIAFLFAIILINLGTNKASVLNLEQKYLNKIGIFSFGLYLIHKFINDFVLQFIKIENYWLQNIAIFTASILLSALISYLLYYNYEIRFIRLKKKFS